MTQVEVKRNDVGVTFIDTLTLEGFDFTGCAVRFLLVRVSGAGSVSAVAEQSNATTGSIEVAYTTVGDDLANAGLYRQEWEVTKGDSVLTFPSDGYNEVRVLADLNDA